MLAYSIFTYRLLGSELPWVCSFGVVLLFLSNQAFGKLKREWSLVWCLGHLAVWRGTPGPCSDKHLEYKYFTLSFFSCPAVYTSLIIGLLGYGSCMNTAVGYAGDACSTYLLPRSLSESFLGLDLLLRSQPMCLLEQGLQVQYAEEKLA